MDPNLDIQTWTGQVEIRGDDLQDITGTLTVEWANDQGHYYRGDYKLQADFPIANGNGLVTVDLTHLLRESVIDELIEEYVIS